MKKIKFLFLATAVVGLTSCLKDGPVNFAPDASPPVIEWSTAVADLAPASVTVGSPYRLFSLSYDVSPSSDLKLQLGYTGGGVTKTDINVTVDVDPTAIAPFNAAQNPVTTFEILPTTFYTLPTSAVIPAGTNKGGYTIKINTSAAGFDFNKKYVIPLRIKAVSGTDAPISGNYGTIFLQVGAKNKYDGVYSFTGSAVNPLTPPDRTNVYYGGLWTWPGNINLITASANQVDLYDATYNFGGGTAQWLLLLGATATTGGGFGQSQPRITLDPTTNKVTAIVNMYPNPTNGRAFALDPSYDSNYNPTTKIMTLRFFFSQNSMATNTVTYNFKYVKSR